MVVWYRGRAAYRIRGVGSHTKERLEQIALPLLTHGEVRPSASSSKRSAPGIALPLLTDGELPAEAVRCPEEDDLSDVDFSADVVFQVLLALPVRHLKALARQLDLSPAGTGRELARLVRERAGPDLASLAAETLTRNDWNDIAEELGGRRRKSFEEIAEELTRLRVGSSAAPTSSAALTPAATANDSLAAPQLAAHPPTAAVEAVFVTDEATLVERFQRACEEAASIQCIVPSFETDRGRSPLWQALLEHLSKLSAAYVGLEGARSDLVGLRTLYQKNKLRLLPATDGSIRAHVWRFDNDERTVVFSLSGSFGNPGLLAPLLGASVWHGPSASAYGQSVARLFHHAQALAHVAPAGFEQTYKTVADHVRPLIESAQEQMTAAFIEPIPSIEDLDQQRVPDPYRRFDVLRELQKRITDHAERVEDRSVSGSDGKCTVYWVSALGIWALFRDHGPSSQCWFGVQRPHSAQILHPAVAWHIHFDGEANGNLVLRQQEDGDVVLVERTGERLVVVCEATGPAALRHLAAHVHQADRLAAIVHEEDGAQ